MSFADLGLSPQLLEAIKDQGYENPTPIQAEAIPHVLKGRDVLGIAQTGTGKTASFTLPMIDRLAQGRAKARMPRSLIIAPTRELATQVAENFETYGKNSKLSMALLIGGVAFTEQERKIDRGVDVLIATPGRLLDHIERGKLVLLGVQVLVIDEADRMLDMGFIPDVEKICSLVPAKNRQMLFFSATMPPEITRLADRFLNDPVRVEVARQSTTAENVTQKLAECAPRDKRTVLRHLMKSEEVKNAIIFCNRKRDVAELFRSLERHGFNAGALHGDIPQNLRTQTLEKFRSGEITTLVASDVAARGLDIPAVSHVFNFDVPMNAEDYVHRIGRTGRAGRSGAAFTLVTRSDEQFLKAIKDLIKKDIETIDLSEITGAKTSGDAKSSSDAKADDDAGDKPEKRSRNSRTAKKADRSSDDEAPSNRRSRGGRGRGRNNRDDDRDDKPVVGLGDHVPAFLEKPVAELREEARKSA